MQIGRGRTNCLSDYLILDLTSFLAGPYCTDVLTALGATVIKVEPPSGDYYRSVRPPYVGSEGATLDAASAGDDALALSFLKRNGNKLSIVLDLQSDQGRRVLTRLVGRADALVQNYKPGTARRLGVTGPELHGMNPRLIYVALDGLGPYADDGDERPVIDYGVQALSGVMSMAADPDGVPRWLGLPIADVAGGLYAAIAVLAGLLGRDGRRHKQEPSSYSVSLLGALSAIAWSFRAPDAIHRWSLPDVNATSNPSTGTRLLRTVDSKWVFLSGVSQQQWERIVAATGIPALADTRYRDRAARDADRTTIYDHLDEWARGLSQVDVLERLTEHHVSAWPVRRPAELLEDDRFRDGFLYEVEHPTYGPSGLYGVVSPVRANYESDFAEDRCAPLLGEHTEHVLVEYGGFSRGEVQDLIAEGVVQSRSRREEGV